jgi:hypothetical protein
MNKAIYALMFIAMIDGVFATTSIAACQNLSTLGETYQLSGPVSLTTTTKYSSTGCFNITADNIILDCNGFSITVKDDSGWSPTNPNQMAGVRIYANYTTIKNCIIYQAHTGIYVSSANNGIMKNLTINTAWVSNTAHAYAAIYILNSNYTNISNSSLYDPQGVSNLGPFPSAAVSYIGSSNSILTDSHLYEASFNLMASRALRLDASSSNNTIVGNIIEVDEGRYVVDSGVENTYNNSTSGNKYIYSGDEMWFGWTYSPAGYADGTSTGLCYGYCAIPLQSGPYWDGNGADYRPWTGIWPTAKLTVICGTGGAACTGSDDSSLGYPYTDGAVNITIGANKSINATPTTNYVFTNWEVTSGNCTVTNTLSDKTFAEFLNTTSDCEITASFDPVSTANLMVIKHVVNSQNGTATADQFNIHVMQNGTDVGSSPQPGNESGTNYTLAFGTYQISEDLPGSEFGGYSAFFSGDCDLSGNIIISGENVTCTITNNDHGMSFYDACVSNYTQYGANRSYIERYIQCSMGSIFGNSEVGGLLLGLIVGGMMLTFVMFQNTRIEGKIVVIIPIIVLVAVWAGWIIYLAGIVLGLIVFWAISRVINR